MNILLLTPGINKKFNDNFYAYEYMSKINNNILAITQRENINKGGRLEVCSPLEVYENLVINRVFDTLQQQNSILGRFFKYSKIKKIISDFKPDLIFCEELSNIQFAINIKKKFNIPLVLRVEFAFDESYPYRTMGDKLKYLRNPLTKDFFPILLGRSIWKWAVKNSDAVISCFFEDYSKQTSRAKMPPFYFVPWPTFQPEMLSNISRNKNRAVFIGSFDRHKNLEELTLTLPLIFQHTPINEFYIVGTGEDLHAIEKLKKKFPKNIVHLVSLSREKCLELIKSSYFSYSPAVRGGWGFIGDSWAMKTPVLVTHNHYGFNDGVDSIVTNPDQIVERVNYLYQNDFFDKISLGGYNRFTSIHTAESVGLKYSEICLIATKGFDYS